MSAKLGASRAVRSYASCEWYTPTWLVDRIRVFYGGSYFDPCPARNGQPLAQNGLAITWHGRVFCNPPYGRGIDKWIRKAMTEPADELMLLVPAYTDTDWFTPLFDHAICFVHGRLYFHRPGGLPDTRTPHPSVLVYRGPRVRAFADAFADLGPILTRKRARRSKQPRLLEVS